MPGMREGTAELSQTSIESLHEYNSLSYPHIEIQAKSSDRENEAGGFNATQCSPIALRRGRSSEFGLPRLRC